MHIHSRKLRFEPLESRWLLAAVKYINPALGSDSNSGDAAAPWATLEKAEQYANANHGAMSELRIDTTLAPLHVAANEAETALEPLQEIAQHAEGVFRRRQGGWGVRFSPDYLLRSPMTRAFVPEGSP